MSVKSWNSHSLQRYYELATKGTLPGQPHSADPFLDGWGLKSVLDAIYRYDPDPRFFVFDEVWRESYTIGASPSMRGRNVRDPRRVTKTLYVELSAKADEQAFLKAMRHSGLLHASMHPPIIDDAPPPPKREAVKASTGPLLPKMPLPDHLKK